MIRDSFCAACISMRAAWAVRISRRRLGSLGTVYRNLSLLADLGEIKKLSSFAGADHFDGRTERHCHFMCTRCERIIDLENEKIHHIMELAGENFGGKITDYSARFFGLCEDCLKETTNNSDTSENASDKN